MAEKKQTNLIYYSILLALIFGIYHPVYDFDFLIGWDDQLFITNFYTEDKLHLDNLYTIFTDFYRGQYAPLNQLHYTSLYTVFGYNKTIFHLGSVIIHFLNAVFVYHFSTATWRRLSCYISFGLSIRHAGFLTAVFFAILPINVEPVAWVSASKVLIYAFFYLLSLLLYIHYLEKRKPVYYYLVLGAYLLSFFGKEQAVSLPLALLLLDGFWNRNLRDKDVWLEKIPFLILSVLFGLITIESQGLQDVQRSFYPLYQRLPLGLYTLLEYFTKSIIPVNLSYLYPFPFQNGDAVPGWMWVYIVFIPLLGYYLLSLKNRVLNFALLFFIIHIGLVLNLTPLSRHFVIADRYTYIAAIGVCILLTYGFGYIYSKKKKTAVLIAGLYLMALCSYSYIYVHTWKNAYTVKERLKKTIEARPDFEELKKLK